jgi:putative nucleic acid modification protein with dual OB domain
MRIVVNHLTRVRGGYVCVAGFDLDCNRHVRPVVPEGALPFDLLARYGGPFDMAQLVELGIARAAPRPPHVEDQVIVPERAKSRGTLPPDEFWGLLNRVSETRLADIFGADLKSVGRSSCGTEEGKGQVSLGLFRPGHSPELYYRDKNPGGKPAIRIRVRDDDFDAILGVTDLRMYKGDHMTPDRAVIERTARRIADAKTVILGVGLTRPFAASSAQKNNPVHWLQVTNVHLADDPTWRLG